MLNLLVFVGVVLLLIIAVQLAFIASRQRAMNAWLIQALLPKDQSFHEGSMDEQSCRSVIDQFGVLLAQVDNRVSSINGMVKYFRNYVWEVLDHRCIDDIRNPPRSPEWECQFRSDDDPADYGLWKREYDMSEGFRRDVVMPTVRHRKETKSEIGDADLE